VGLDAGCFVQCEGEDHRLGGGRLGLQEHDELIALPPHAENLGVVKANRFFLEAAHALGNQRADPAPAPVGAPDGALPFVVGDIGHVVVLGAKTVEQFGGEVLHCCFLAMRWPFSVS
jgi:hypothetical protein